MSTTYYTLVGSLPALPRHFEDAERVPISVLQLQERLKMLQPHDAEVIEEMKARAASALHAVADHLVGRTYLVNDTFSAADIMLGYAVGLGHALVPEGMPAHLEDYWLRLQDRPAFQIANRA